MKKRYQIDREQAVGNFQEQAKHSEESLQLTLPLKEVAAALQEGVGRLMRDAGLELMQLVMDNEVRQLAGERYERRASETWPTCAPPSPGSSNATIGAGASGRRFEKRRCVCCQRIENELRFSTRTTNYLPRSNTARSRRR